MLAFAIVNRSPADPEHTLASLQWRKVAFELRTVLSVPSTYVGIVVLAGLAGSFWAFANLIGPRLLADHRFTKLESGLEVSILVLGYAFGAAAWGWAGDRFRRDGALVVATTLACLTWAGLLVLGTPSFGIAAAAFFFVGFFSGAFGLVFAVLTERYPPSHSGMVIACVNCGSPLGAAAAQSAAGRLDNGLSLLPLLAAGVAALAGAWALWATRPAGRVRP
jgi:MFS family permease